MAPDAYKWGFHDEARYLFRTEKGLSRKVVEEIAGIKEEPQWMRDMRFRALEVFEGKPMPSWGPDLSAINLNDIYYYARASERPERDWSEVPDYIRQTFDRLGIPEAERKFLAGVGAQYDSETVYHNMRQELAKQGVIFADTDTAVREHPDLVRRYFGTVVPTADNKFAALNSAVWSGGSFIYVPEGVHVDIPLQAYFRINAENIGQFERTLIIAEPGSFVHYIEGCTAPIYTTNSLHAAVVEVIVKKGARVRYSTVQNWSTNVYNLVTKRSVAYEDAIVEWVDGNLGSRVTMKYPAIYLMEPGAHGEVLSLSFAGRGQHQDAGAKAVHAAPYTTSVIRSKSVSKDGGRASYRGLVKVNRGAKGIRSSVRCDALLLDEDSRSDTYPTMEIDERDSSVSHEASVSKVGEEQLFYLQSRGIDEQEATKMVVNGFVEPIVKELPMEYAVELNRLIELQLEGAIG
ncbi:MAG: Fe-S cluster assembly protein SufB [Dehalococcoidia bacterium]|jgi:Fe-S cluster assembly protein SufB|nr:Fe-S cluster assembly protein SufB [Dehalococcoidia bacterium]